MEYEDLPVHINSQSGLNFIFQKEMKNRLPTYFFRT